MTTVLLAIPTHLILRRWRPPFGSFTVFYGVVVALFAALDEFGHASTIVAGLIAGVAADLVAARWAPATGAAAATILWLGYFATYQLTEGGVRWSAEIWTGAVVLSALLAAAVGVLATAPPGPSHARPATPSVAAARGGVQPG